MMEKQQPREMNIITLVLWNLSIARSTEAFSVPCLETSSSQKRRSLGKRNIEPTEIPLHVSPKCPRSCSVGFITEIFKGNKVEEYRASPPSLFPRLENYQHLSCLFHLYSPPLFFSFFDAFQANPRHIISSLKASVCISPR